MSASTLLPTSVIGSWSVPDWLERAKTGVHHGAVSRTQLADMHDMAVKAALKDQEIAGIDIVSDGELRRDNDVDYLLARVPGVRCAGAGQGVLLRLPRPARHRAAAGARARRRSGWPRTCGSPSRTPTARCGSR